MRGVLILLVIIGHLIPQFAACIESRLFRCVFFVIYGFHMQAFVFAAGYCSTRLLENMSVHDANRFLRYRAVRLLVPYMVWGCVYFTLRFALPSLVAAQYDLSRSWQFAIGYNPDGALWFLWSLFAATLVVMVGLRILSLGRCTFLSALLALVALATQPWLRLPVAINALPLFIFFFCAGLCVRLHYERLRPKMENRTLGLAIAMVWLVVMTLHPNSVAEIPWYLLGLTSVTGTALLLFFAIRLTAGPACLAAPWTFLSGYAMEIYILAEPVKVACRTVFFRLGMPVSISFVAMLVLMLAVPILLSRFVLLGTWLPLLLLGRRPRKADAK